MYLSIYRYNVHCLMPHDPDLFAPCNSALCSMADTEWCRYQTTADATKAMQQLDGLDIAGSQISVKIAPMTPAETAAAAAAVAGLDLDNAEGGPPVSQPPHCPTAMFLRLLRLR